MGFDLVARLGAQVAHQAVEHTERIEIVPLLGNLVLERFHERLAGLLDDLHRVGHDEAADARAADDHELERLVEHVEVPAHGHEAAEDAADRNDKTNDDIHERRCPNTILTLGKYGSSLA